MRHWHIAALAAIVALGVTRVPALAHHSFAAIYLESDTIEIEGEIVEFQYRNPHTWVQVQAEDSFGHPTLYAAEWGSVSALERQGVLKNSLKVGDHVRMWVSPNKNPTDTRVRLKKIQMPNGRTLGGQARIDQDREQNR